MPEYSPSLPEFTRWPSFPFEGDMRVKRLADPVDVEPPRSGEDAGDCVACNTPDDSYIWVSERWRVRAMDRPTGLPMVLILECRSHLDLGDLPNLLAAELGVMTVRLERAIRSLDGVARVHVNRWGDGSAHLHMWFLARPYGRLQLRGTFLSLWDDILPVIPEEQWRGNLALVAAWLAEFGGRAIAEPPHIHWESPSTFSNDATVSGATRNHDAMDPAEVGGQGDADGTTEIRLPTAAVEMSERAPGPEDVAAATNEQAAEDVDAVDRRKAVEGGKAAGDSRIDIGDDSELEAARNSETAQEGTGAPDGERGSAPGDESPPEGGSAAGRGSALEGEGPPESGSAAGPGSTPGSGSAPAAGRLVEGGSAPEGGRLAEGGSAQERESEQEGGSAQERESEQEGGSAQERGSRLGQGSALRGGSAGEDGSVGGTGTDARSDEPGESTTDGKTGNAGAERAAGRDRPHESLNPSTPPAQAAKDRDTADLTDSARRTFDEGQTQNLTAYARTLDQPAAPIESAAHPAERSALHTSSLANPAEQSAPPTASPAQPTEPSAEESSAQIRDA